MRGEKIFFYVFIVYILENRNEEYIPVPSSTGLMSKNGQSLQKVKEIMQERKQFLYRGEIWFMHPESRCTKVRLCDVDSWLGNLCSNPLYQGLLLERKDFLMKILSDDRCSVIEQVELDLDTFEVKPILFYLFVDAFLLYVLRVKLRFKIRITMYLEISWQNDVPLWSESQCTKVQLLGVLRQCRPKKQLVTNFKIEFFDLRHSTIMCVLRVSSRDFVTVSEYEKCINITCILLYHR